MCVHVEAIVRVLKHHTACSWGQGPYLTWSSSVSLSWLDSELQNYACLSLPNAGIASVPLGLALISVFFRLNLGPHAFTEITFPAELSFNLLFLIQKKCIYLTETA